MLPPHIGYLLKDLCVTVNAILDDGFNIFSFHYLGIFTRGTIAIISRLSARISEVYTD